MKPEKVIPLGDQAILAYFTREDDAVAFAAAVEERQWSWVVEVVPAYASVAVFFDLRRTTVDQALKQVEEFVPAARPRQDQSGRLHRIPCCYELGPDLERVSGHTGLASAEITRLHSETEYRVYAIGFCPGFPYLGYLPPVLSGVPRLDSPRVRVEPGSVGVTGRQTGIYPLPRPGGWNLIGRTPLEIVNVADDYFPLRAGDRVRFDPIGKAEYRRRLGERLPTGP